MTSEDFFRKICTSHFTVRVRKGFLRVLLWEGVGDRIELQYILTPLLWPSALCLFRSPDAQPEARGLSLLLSAGFLYHILSPTGLRNYWGHRGSLQPPSAWSGFPYHILSATSLIPKSIGGPEPLRPGVAFPTTPRPSVRSLTVKLLVLTELYNSSTPTQSPTQSLEWHVWLSSSGNNCHAGQRSLSSGTSVYECTMGFFTFSHFVSQARLRDFLS